MNQRLINKNVVITGASGGIGEKIALKAAESGANVVLMARNEDRLKELQKTIESRYKVKAFIHSVDVSRFESIPSVFQSIYREVENVDILVNNAGYGIFDEADQASFEDIKGMFDVNVLGLIACTKHVLPIMKKETQGISSTSLRRQASWQHLNPAPTPHQSMLCSGTRTACAWKQPLQISMLRPSTRGRLRLTSSMSQTVPELMPKMWNGSCSTRMLLPAKLSAKC